MKNRITISNNGSSVLFSLIVKAERRGKIVLTLLVLLLIGVVVFALSNTPRSAFPKIIIPATIIGGLIFYFPIRYWLWNLYGEELFAITTRSVSIERSYGFYRTPLETFPFSTLFITIDTTRRFDGEEYGTMGFHGQDPGTGLPVLLVQTTVIMARPDLVRIQNEIDLLFQKENIGDARFPALSLN